MITLIIQKHIYHFSESGSQRLSRIVEKNTEKRNKYNETTIDGAGREHVRRRIGIIFFWF